MQPFIGNAPLDTQRAAGQFTLDSALRSPIIPRSLEAAAMQLRLKIKEVLQEKRVSQSKLSRLADVSLNTIQRTMARRIMSRFTPSCRVV